MILGEVFKRFAEKSPVTVMARATLEYALPRHRIDELFRERAQKQYEDELLFSSVVDLLSLVVCSTHKSVNSAYKYKREEFTVSVESLYNKLKKTELAVSRALVQETAKRLKPVIRSMKATHKPLLSGWRVKILDGNHFTGTEHRLKETRVLHSSPLPGQALVLLEPEYMLMTDIVPCEDAHAQERRMLGQVLDLLEAKDLLIADRNFCTTDFIFSLFDRKVDLVIRQHASTLSGKELIGKRRRIGRSDHGVIYEQQLQICGPDDRTLMLCRVTVELDKPTENGETEVHLVTKLPKRIGARRVAQLYLERWTIERAFHELEQALESEIATLCYPKAAVLVFSVAVLTYNILSTLKAALRAQHGEEAVAEKLSGYYLADEISIVYGGMMIAIPAARWAKAVRNVTPRQMGTLLKDLATHAKPERFYKTSRGEKKPRPVRTGGLREKHVSTARLLARRKLSSTAQQ